MSKSSKPPFPLKLPETVALYKKIDSEMSLDTKGKSVLLTGCEAHQRMREAQAILDKEGLTSRDRNGIPRPHPAVTIERNCRTSMLTAFRMLSIEPDLEDEEDGYEY